MRRPFEDEDPEQEEIKERNRDLEVTMGPGTAILALLGLLLLGALCFGLGYVVGHRSPARSSAGATPAQTAAPDQEPLQGSGAIPKPPAAAQAPVAPPPASDGSQPATTPDSGANPATPSAQPGPAAAGPGAAPPNTPPGAAQPQVRPAMPNANYPPPPAPAGAAPNLRTAPPGLGQLMVQVAAVSHEEDADVLVNALRKRGYAVSSQRQATDGLIHVRIGPFATREEATRMARRLLDDGYNAMVQP